MWVIHLHSLTCLPAALTNKWLHRWPDGFWVMAALDHVVLLWLETWMKLGVPGLRASAEPAAGQWITENNEDCSAVRASCRLQLLWFIHHFMSLSDDIWCDGWIKAGCNCSLFLYTFNQYIGSESHHTVMTPRCVLTSPWCAPAERLKLRRNKWHFQWLWSLCSALTHSVCGSSSVFSASILCLWALTNHPLNGA